MFENFEAVFRMVSEIETHEDFLGKSSLASLRKSSVKYNGPLTLSRQGSILL
jgi:hypothetical protein